MIEDSLIDKIRQLDGRVFKNDKNLFVRRDYVEAIIRQHEVDAAYIQKMPVSIHVQEISTENEHMGEGDSSAADAAPEMVVEKLEIPNAPSPTSTSEISGNGNFERGLQKVIYDQFLVGNGSGLTAQAVLGFIRPYLRTTEPVPLVIKELNFTPEQLAELQKPGASEVVIDTPVSVSLERCCNAIVKFQYNAHPQSDAVFMVGIIKTILNALKEMGVQFDVAD